MITLFGSVLLASFVGSAHCAAMCGPFVACGVGPGPGRGGALRQAAYHAGRLTSYSIVGLIAGTAGAALDQGGLLVGLQRASLIFAAFGLLSFGSGMLLRRFGWWKTDVRGGWFQRLYVATFARLQRLPATTRALAIGMLTSLLPCGWLYAFAILAAGAGSPALGAMVMAAFWLGTMPVLVLIGAGTRLLTPRLRRSLPTAAALVLIVAGLYGLVIRWSIPSLAAMQQQVAAEVEGRESSDLPLPLDATHDASPAPRTPRTPRTPRSVLFPPNRCVTRPDTRS